MNKEELEVKEVVEVKEELPEIFSISRKYLDRNTKVYSHNETSFVNFLNQLKNSRSTLSEELSSKLMSEIQAFFEGYSNKSNIKDLFGKKISKDRLLDRVRKALNKEITGFNNINFSKIKEMSSKLYVGTENTSTESANRENKIKERVIKETTPKYESNGENNKWKIEDSEDPYNYGRRKHDDLTLNTTEETYEETYEDTYNYDETNNYDPDENRNEKIINAVILGIILMITGFWWVYLIVVIIRFSILSKTGREVTMLEAAYVPPFTKLKKLFAK